MVVGVVVDVALVVDDLGDVLEVLVRVDGEAPFLADMVLPNDNWVNDNDVDDED